jgi:hypothetical protein
VKFSTTANAKKKLTPPYIPARSFTGFLQGLGVHLPSRIDRSVLGSYAGSVQTMLITTLRYFDLIDEHGAPKETLQQLVKAEGAERQRALQQMIRKGYPFLFSSDGFDLGRATPAQIRERFEQAGASGETGAKSISFFAAMAKDAGITLTPTLKTRERRANGKRTPKAKSDKKSAASTPQPPPATPSQTPFVVLYNLLDPKAMDEAEQQAVWTLLQYLKKQESES